MRKILITTTIATVFYLMTGLVYSEGSFDGALVVKPYPMPELAFGGGEEGAWARLHPGQAEPWFMQNNLRVISRFSWEEGSLSWVSAYGLGYLAVLLAWVALVVVATVRLVRPLFKRREI